MSKLVSLHIENFRGIKKMDCQFGSSNVICLIGHCDAGKTTILTAISYLFSSSWTIPVSDEDFHKMNIEEPIRIEGIIANVPAELITFDKFGLHTFEYGNLESPSQCLKLVLTIEKDLEPRWEVCNVNNDEYHAISHKDRSLFNIRLIDDYFDAQFNMSKYSLLKNLVSSLTDKPQLSSNIGVDLIREIRDKLNIGEATAAQVSDKLNESIRKIGGEGRKYSLAVPMGELMLRGNQVGLQADDVPVKLLGKGTRRQLSLALQLALNNDDTSSILIDEVEQGLEPYRVKTIVRALKDTKQQVFMTSHSSMALAELDATDLYLVKSGSDKLVHLDENYQALLRSNPDAFFFDKLIVCEGETEYGFFLELDRYLWLNEGYTTSSYSASPLLGKGKGMIPIIESLNNLGVNNLCFMDNDDDDATEALNGKTIICNCEKGYSIEQQIFKDAPTPAIQEYVEWAKAHTKLSDDFEFNESQRDFLGKQSKSGKWFKSVGGGRLLGEIFFKYYKQMNIQSHLYHQIESILFWLQNGIL